MSLIECCECGKEISSRAARCVHCGYPTDGNGSRSGTRRSRILLGLLLIAVLAGIVIEKDSFLRFLQTTHPMPHLQEEQTTESLGKDISTNSRQIPTVASESAVHEESAASGPLSSIDLRPNVQDASETPDEQAATPAPATASPEPTSGEGDSITIDPAAIIRHVIAKDKDIYKVFQSLDYKHYWTVEDLDLVAKCEADRKELLYGLSTLDLIDHNPKYGLIIEFLRLENTVATTVMDYFRDMVASRYTRPAPPLFVTRLQKAFSEIRELEKKLEKHGWTKAYSTWGQGK